MPAFAVLTGLAVAVLYVNSEYSFLQIAYAVAATFATFSSVSRLPDCLPWRGGGLTAFQTVSRVGGGISLPPPLLNIEHQSALFTTIRDE